MEIKEAIEWLKSIDKKYINGGDEGFDSKRHEAMRVAISALEKQEGEKPTHEETIKGIARFMAKKDWDRRADNVSKLRFPEGDE